MSVQDLKYNFFIGLVPILQLMHDQELDKTMVVQTTHRVDHIFPDLIRHLLQVIKEIEWKIKKLLVEKVCQ